MKELLELHILQNFAPSNLNRDDTGSPKDAVFGGARRSRISSQCLKRSMRTYVREHQLLPRENMAERSRLFNTELCERLVSEGKDKEVAEKVVETALAGLGLKLDKKKEHTEYLIFLGGQELDRLAQLVLENWEELETVALTKKAKSKDKKEAVSKELAKALNSAVRKRGEGGDAVDVALFGRMLADRPELNQDAACQVAHAISTHKIAKDFDYFTAVDELKKDEDDAGAAMLGTTEFNSSCFYRYLAIDLALLKQNLQDDTELLERGLKAFVEAGIKAIPTGKQNSFAAHNPPSFVALRYRQDAAPVNMANAFEKPVWDSKKAISAASEEKLKIHWDKLDSFYGQPGETRYWSEHEKFEIKEGTPVKSIGELLEQVGTWVKGS